MRRAFTLIEMTVVIGFLALLAAIAVPSVTRMAEARRDQSRVDGFYNLLRTAPLLARSDGKTLTAVLDPGESQIRIQDGDDVLREATLPASAEIGEVRRDGKVDATRVRFFEDGTSETTSIQLRLADGERWIVVTQAGAVNWSDEPAREARNERWPAGDFQRVQG